MKNPFKMKNTLSRLLLAASLPVILQTASAQVLLTDNFTVDANKNDPNYELGNGRQTGTQMLSDYRSGGSQHQLGNPGTFVGQPGGATNSHYLLLAFTAGVQNNTDVASAATGPLVVSFDMYFHSDGNPYGGDPSDWGAFSLRANRSDGFPVAQAGEFGFLTRYDGRMQVFQNGGSIEPSAWDALGFATNDSWTLIFTDTTTGTNSAFIGLGSQVTIVNGTNTLGTIVLSQLNSSGLYPGFDQNANMFVGVANFSMAVTPPTIASNLSFELNAVSPGESSPVVPAGWLPFNKADGADIGSENAGGTDYTVYNPLAAPADGNQFCYINMFSDGVTGGIYQDMGPMQTNTIYTLTVAIGSRDDMQCSPGIISLVNGTDNTGLVLATGGGLPASQDTWQDYSVSFTNGAALSGDLTIVLSVVGASTIQADFDNVILTATPVIGAIAPMLLVDNKPIRSEVTTGGPVSLSVTANGSLPLYYQWFNQDGPISGATSASYSFSAVAGTNEYYVQVTNSGGSITSSIAVVFSATNIVTVNNFSFENGTTGSGFIVLPLSWTPFNDNNFCTVSSGGYSVTNPLASPADGNDFFAINEGPGDPTGGIYQDVGALLPNTIYTLTVAIGLPLSDEGSPIGSPGIISLINGANNTGTVLATTNGLPSTYDAWQDISVSFTTGSTVSGDLTIALSVAGASSYQAEFDNVRLTAAAVVGPVPPRLLADVEPIRSEVTTGGPLTLSVTANGSPLLYQWFNQNGPISGATSASYSFNAVAGTNQYYVEVTNSAGSVTSSTAVVFSATNIVTVNNFSFENGTTGSGLIVLPVSWTPFNDNNFCTVSSGSYSITNPLALPADGNDFFAINEGPGDPTGGIYQDVGALLPNTIYTLTVAIGLPLSDEGSPIGSPGIISLINGANNTGTVLATTNGLPSTYDAWQDISVSFTTGSTVSGDLTIALSVAGASSYQAEFDDVILTKAAMVGPVAPTLLADVEPIRSEVTTGGPVSLSVTANGSLLQYQWFNQNGPISGATSASYSFNAVAGTNQYYVEVTNSAGSVTSSTAVVFSATNIVTVNNFSFENGTTGSGLIVLPVSWTPFNDNNFCTVSSGSYSITNPLALPADGNDFFAINEGPGDPTGGIYQDVGALQPNTIYTLTVAIGLPLSDEGSAIGSPGIITLINGANNTGKVLATTSGLPSTYDAWQDFSVSFTTGASVSGDLTIALSVAGASSYQAEFDNVQLTATPLLQIGATVSGGNLILTGVGGTAGGGYTVLSSTNLAVPSDWITNGTGVFSGTGAFSYSIPVTNSVPAVFYLLQVP